MQLERTPILMPEFIHNNPCSECGASPNRGKTCTDHYHACLALEYPNPTYGRVHHFTVLAYQLQHPSQLSAVGWQAMQKLLGRFLQESISPEKMRVQLRKQMQYKSFSMVKGEPVPDLTWKWSKTILDVRQDHAEMYCADVRAWAESVYNDIKQHEEVS